MDKEYYGFANLGGTYRIVSTLNGKLYYGSCKCFKVRASQHERQLKQNKHGNSHLQNAFNLNGTDNFSFEVIEPIVNSKDERLRKEQILLDYHFDGGRDCYNLNKLAKSCMGRKYPKGKLINSGQFKKGNPGPWLGKKRPDISGENHHLKRKPELIKKGIEHPNAKMIDLHSIPLISPTGEAFYKIDCVTEFCREHNLIQQNLWKVLNGQRQYHREWELLYLTV